MRRIKIVGLCAAILMVAGTSAVASASAEPPEVGRCIKFKVSEKPYKGKFTTASCTVKSETETGKFEWFPGYEKASFTVSGGISTWEETGKNAWNCESMSATGEYVGTREMTSVNMAFKGCNLGGTNCKTEGASIGEIVMNPLGGRLVWEDEAADTLALDLFPVNAEGKFAEFNCGAVTVAMTGSVLVPVKENKMALSESLKYTASHGFQSLEFYEEAGSLVQDVIGFNFAGKGVVQGSIIITATLTNEEKLEYKSV